MRKRKMVVTRGLYHHATFIAQISKYILIMLVSIRRGLRRSSRPTLVVDPFDRQSQSSAQSASFSLKNAPHRQRRQTANPCSVRLYQMKHRQTGVHVTPGHFSPERPSDLSASGKLSRSRRAGYRSILSSFQLRPVRFLCFTAQYLCCLCTYCTIHQPIR